MYYLGNTVRGSLDNDCAACAILQLLNTPIQEFGLSLTPNPFSQTVTRSYAKPSYTTYVFTKNGYRERQSAASTNNHMNTSSHKLSPLEAGDNVLIHDPPSVRGHKLVELLRYYPTGNTAFR